MKRNRFIYPLICSLRKFCYLHRNNVCSKPAAPFSVIVILCLVLCYTSIPSGPIVSLCFCRRCTVWTQRMKMLQRWRWRAWTVTRWHRWRRSCWMLCTKGHRTPRDQRPQIWIWVRSVFMFVCDADTQGIKRSRKCSLKQEEVLQTSKVVYHQENS